MASVDNLPPGRLGGKQARTDSSYYSVRRNLCGMVVEQAEEGEEQTTPDETIIGMDWLTRQLNRRDGREDQNQPGGQTSPLCQTNQTGGLAWRPADRPD